MDYFKQRVLTNVIGIAALTTPAATAQICTPSNLQIGPCVDGGDIRCIEPAGFQARPLTRVQANVASLGGVPAPLILALHPFGSEGWRPESTFHLCEPTRLANGFILAAPQAIGPVNGPPAWNATASCCDVAGLGVDDVGYLSALVDLLASSGLVDTRRVYVLGQSNGGFMAYRMAYERPDLFAAVACFSGAAPEEVLITPATPVPMHVLHFHGSADGVVKPAGGSFMGLTPYPSLVQTLDAWQDYIGCAGPRQDVGVLDLFRDDGFADTRRSIATGCTSPDASLELWWSPGIPHLPAFGENVAQLLVDYLYSKQQDGLGTILCPTQASATVTATVLGAIGDRSHAGGEITLIVEDLPQGSAVQFYAASGVSPASPGSGQLCLTGPVIALGTGTGVNNYGRAARRVIATDIAPVPFVGLTTYFQAQSAATATSPATLSNVLEVTWN